MTAINEQELFTDNFGEWLELHGVDLSPMLVGDNLVAHVNLNVLKPAIMRFVQAYGNKREEDALRTIWAFDSDSMLELREFAGRRVAELTKLKDTNRKVQ